MLTKDGGKEIVAGNERGAARAPVGRQILLGRRPARRRWKAESKSSRGSSFTPSWAPRPSASRASNELAGEIAAKIGADVEKSKRAARLAKADLTTGVVGEFPELQGVMGRYYALHDKEDAAVTDAIRDHYKPVGPSDAVPTDKVSVVVALADKLDALTGFSRPGKSRPAPAILSRCAARAGRHRDPAGKSPAVCAEPVPRSAGILCGPPEGGTEGKGHSPRSDRRSVQSG